MAHAAVMGFFTRLFFPRSLRRAIHPVRGMKRAVTPRSVRRARRAMHPLDNAAYGLGRALTPSRKRKRTGGRSRVYTHGACSVKHRTSDAAANCRNR